jgi:serine protease Do
MKLSKKTLVGGFLLVGALLLVDSQVPQLAYAQKKGGGLPGGTSAKQDPKFLALFQDSVATAAKSTLRIQCDGKDTALGVVVAADGYILTKASDLTGKITVKTREGIILEARVVGKHEGHDLAMLKVEAWGFIPIEWSETKQAPVGHFVASVGPGPVPVAIGVVSVAARDMPPTKGPAPKGGPPVTAGYLGVTMADGPNGLGAVITSVVSGTPAAAAKLKVDDLVLAVDQTVVKSADSFREALQQHKAGDTVTLKVVRGPEEMELRATLGKQPGNPKGGGGIDQNQMGSRLSNRRTGFPTILQHDSVVLPEDCGGPLVNLDGKVVAINIARAGRVESWAVPAETIRPLLAQLMGKQPSSTPQKQ